MTILGLTVATIGITSVTVGAVIVGPISTTIASVTGVMMVVAWMVTTIRDLRAARAEIARLAAVEAVAEERLRFACDLHDLRGAADNVRNATRCGTPGHRDAGYGRLEAASALHAQLPRRASG